jgi:hypothetical protein
VAARHTEHETARNCMGSQKCSDYYSSSIEQWHKQTVIRSAQHEPAYWLIWTTMVALLISSVSLSCISCSSCRAGRRGRGSGRRTGTALLALADALGADGVALLHDVAAGVDVGVGEVALAAALQGARGDQRTPGICFLALPPPCTHAQKKFRCELVIASMYTIAGLFWAWISACVNKIYIHVGQVGMMEPFSIYLLCGSQVDR